MFVNMRCRVHSLYSAIEDDESELFFRGFGQGGEALATPRTGGEWSILKRIAPNGTSGVEGGLHQETQAMVG